MKTEIFLLELITPCFCGGAEPEKRAEIRAPSIRGQLRWWFRTLGGFKSLAQRGLSVRDQEAMIFGSTAGDQGNAGKLIIRVAQPATSLARKNADELDAATNTSLGYALFPLRKTPDSDGRRGMLREETKFSLSLVWRGEPGMINSLCGLVSVWAHLGCQGFRGRRAFGALRLVGPPISLTQALSGFASPNKVLVRTLNSRRFTSWRDCASELLRWYRSWRQHGQMYQRWDKHDKRWIRVGADQQEQNRGQPGFRFARRDHNEGLDVQGTRAPNRDPEQPEGRHEVTFRPALGLPIIQFFSSLENDHGEPMSRGRATVNWDWNWNTQKRKGEGRFASPVLLRPHRDANGDWHALVIFVDAHQWPPGKEVFLNGQPRSVSLDLYNAMKADPALRAYP